MSKTHKMEIYTKREGHKHVFMLEDQRTEDMLDYYMNYEVLYINY